MERNCKQCGLDLAVADTPMLRHWIARSTGAIGDRWEPRLRQHTTLVCPKCDAYALGTEHSTGMAIYAPTPAAFLTVNDWDWWNRDPTECDIRPWPDFACLTFSKTALRSTVDFLREIPPDDSFAMHLLVFEKPLLGPVGIPEGEDASREWAKQLRILRKRMEHEFSALELNAAVRLLVGTLAEDGRGANPP